MTIWRTLSGSTALAVIARVRSQIALPMAGSCSQAFHGPIRAPSSRSVWKALKLVEIPLRISLYRAVCRSVRSCGAIRGKRMVTPFNC